MAPTTRPRRPEEQAGADYHFLTPAAFDDLRARDELLEHATYSGNCYNCSNSDWDSGSAAAGFVAGAVVTGAVAAASTYPSTTTVVATSSPPCSVAPTSVSGVSYYRCGATWYTAGYENSGVVYMPVAPPPGY